MLRDNREEVEHWQEQQCKYPQGKVTTGRGRLQGSASTEKVFSGQVKEKAVRETTELHSRQLSSYKKQTNEKTQTQSPHILSEPNISGR